MGLIGKLITIILLLCVLFSTSAYIVIYTDDSTGGSDTTPPQITSSTGNFTITAGQNATIMVVFTDNIDVTTATLHYKPVGQTTWNKISILTGSATIPTQISETRNYYYYIIVDDAAGNGPVGDPSTDGILYYTITVKPDTNTDNNDFIHTVFIEETTRQGCRYCPTIGNMLETIESKHAYRFYYISMIWDNPKAATYLDTVYQRVGDPTVFIDGGYKVLYGSLHPEANFTSAIQAAENRNTPEISVAISANYINTTHTLTTTATVTTGEQTSYTGHLRVYLTEIISSQYNDYNGQKYKNAFVDFLIDDDVTIAENRQQSFTVNSSLGSLDYENLKLYAVVFNATENTAYSDPPYNQHTFTAHYADAVNVTYVAQGQRNLPPEVGIISPQKGKIYFRSHIIFNFLYKKALLSNTWIIGKSTIGIYAKDDSKITKVEVYINDKPVANMTSAPYNYTIPSKFIKKPFLPASYTIMVKAYDDTGKTATDSIDVKAWWVF